MRPLASTDGDVASFAVAGLVPSSVYYFAVQAYNSSGGGPLSACAVGATPAAPPDLSWIYLVVGVVAVSILIGVLVALARQREDRDR